MSAATVAPAALAGCHTGSDAQTTQLYTAASGTDVRDGDVKILDALVVDNEDGTGLLIGGLLNTTTAPDALATVTAADPAAEDAPITVSEPTTPVELVPDRLVQLADPELVETSAIVLEGEAIEPGEVVEVTLEFEVAGSVSAEVPVVPRELAWATVATPPPVEEPPAESEGSGSTDGQGDQGGQGGG